MLFRSAELLVRDRGGVAISAVEREGIDRLLEKADTTLFAEGMSPSLGLVAEAPSVTMGTDALPAEHILP